VCVGPNDKNKKEKHINSTSVYRALAWMFSSRAQKCWYHNNNNNFLFSSSFSNHLGQQYVKLCVFSCCCLMNFHY
jgi:hypothetical protein